MVELDGSLGEGGGQVLRTALAMSAVTGEPCLVRNVRARRPQPGLKAQHAAVARAFAACTGGRVEGAEVGSREVRFEPGPMAGGEVRADIGTAGSIPLFLQALLPALAASGSFWRVTVEGGTDGKWAPTFDYFARVHVDTLERLGFRPRVKLVRRGYWPRGGGNCVIECGPWAPKPFALEPRGQAWRVGGRVALANLPDHVGARVRTSALERLAEAGLRGEVDVTASPALDPGVSIALWADDGHCLLGADALGERGVTSEQVGRAAADALAAEVRAGAGVDAHALDMLLPYAALAAREGPCRLAAREATPHARTNAQVIEAFLPVRVAFEPGAAGVLVTVGAA